MVIEKWSFFLLLLEKRLYQFNVIYDFQNFRILYLNLPKVDCIFRHRLLELHLANIFFLNYLFELNYLSICRIYRSRLRFYLQSFLLFRQLFYGLKFALVKFIDGLPEFSVPVQGPSQIFFLVLVIAVEHYFFQLLTIRKHTGSLMKSYILFLEYSGHLVHLLSVLEIKEKAPLWVYEISRILLWYKCQWKSVLHGDAILQTESRMLWSVHFEESIKI